MKALSLWQPWASAVALGYKATETRSWSTRYRGKLAIHAAKKRTIKLRNLGIRICMEHGIPVLDNPLGAVVAVAELVDCVLMDDVLIRQQTPRELAYGDWRSGRYAWMLENVWMIEPVAVRGRPRLFEIGNVLDITGASVAQPKTETVAAEVGTPKNDG